MACVLEKIGLLLVPVVGHRSTISYICFRYAAETLSSLNAMHANKQEETAMLCNDMKGIKPNMKRLHKAVIEE